MPLTMTGAGGLCCGGMPSIRLARWLAGSLAQWNGDAITTAMRRLGEIKGGAVRAKVKMTSLFGKTPPALRRELFGVQLGSAPMTKARTGLAGLRSNETGRGKRNKS